MIVGFDNSSNGITVLQIVSITWRSQVEFAVIDSFHMVPTTGTQIFYTTPHHVSCRATFEFHTGLKKKSSSDKLSMPSLSTAFRGSGGWTVVNSGDPNCRGSGPASCFVHF